jgi:hypothetical protein
MNRYPQNAGSSAKMGVPVLMTSGMVDESPAIDDANDLILGFSAEPFQNLTTDNTAKTLSYGSVVNQPDAIIIPVGAPPSDGKIGVYPATDNIIYKANLEAAQSLALTDLPRTAELTKDGTSGQWYADVADASPTAAEGACIQIVELIDPPDTLGGLVGFVVLNDRQQMSQ